MNHLRALSIGRQRAGRRAQELHCVSRSPISLQPRAQIGDRLVVRVEQPPLRQKRVHERVADRALDRLAKLRRAA